MDGGWGGVSERPEPHIAVGAVVACTAHALAVALQGQEYAPEVREVFGGLDAVPAVFTPAVREFAYPYTVPPSFFREVAAETRGSPPDSIPDIGSGPDVDVRDLSPGEAA
jgi:hypothetical protein